MRTAPAFSMIEVLVVVVISALLTTMVTAALSHARDARDRVVCMNRLRQIGVAVTLYASAHGESLPPRYRPGWITFDTVQMNRPDGTAANLGLVMEFLDNGEVYYCPTHRERSSDDLAFDTTANPWNRGQGDSETGINASFRARAFNPALDASPNWSLHHHANKMIYTDFIAVDGWPAQDRFAAPIHAAHGGETIVSLFGDGAAPWINAASLQGIRRIGPTMPSFAQITRYDRLIDLLPTGTVHIHQDSGDDD